VPESAPVILLLGADGQVGHELRRPLHELGELTALGRSALDLRDEPALRDLVRQLAPDVIVNAAAYTAVDRAESEPEIAFAVNEAAPRALAEEAQRADARLVHYSTDYVFDGRQSAPYREEDRTNPLSVYGRSKRAGEVAVMGVSDRHVVLRTSWVFGVHGSNFLKTILRLAAERDHLRVVSDQIGAPTSARQIAEVTCRVVERAIDRDAAFGGLLHLTASGEVSWHAYARHVIERARESGYELRATADSVEPIATAEYPTAAPRPANSRLSTARLRTALDIQLRDWTDDVDQAIHALRPH